MGEWQHLFLEFNIHMNNFVSFGSQLKYELCKDMTAIHTDFRTTCQNYSPYWWAGAYQTHTRTHTHFNEEKKTHKIVVDTTIVWSVWWYLWNSLFPFAADDNWCVCMKPAKSEYSNFLFVVIIAMQWWILLRMYGKICFEANLKCKCIRNEITFWWGKRYSSVTTDNRQINLIHFMNCACIEKIFYVWFAFASATLL